MNWFLPQSQDQIIMKSLWTKNLIQPSSNCFWLWPKSSVPPSWWGFVTSIARQRFPPGSCHSPPTRLTIWPRTYVPIVIISPLPGPDILLKCTYIENGHVATHPISHHVHLRDWSHTSDVYIHLDDGRPAWNKDQSSYTTYHTTYQTHILGIHVALAIWLDTCSPPMGRHYLTHFILGYWFGLYIRPEKGFIFANMEFGKGAEQCILGMVNAIRR